MLSCVSKLVKKVVIMTRLTPFLIARSQLLMAIELFFADKDPVSVQALAGNARELLEDLCRQAGVSPMTELLVQDDPGKSKNDIYNAMNLYRNCFKHLAKNEKKRQDDQLALDQFDDSKNEYLLYICVEDYARLRDAMPLSMQVFHAWFCALHVELLSVPSHAQNFLDLFPGIRQTNRFQQKHDAAACIARISVDPDLLAHPNTEPMIIAH
jgi:hypothetical protein